MAPVPRIAPERSPPRPRLPTGRVHHGPIRRRGHSTRPAWQFLSHDSQRYSFFHNSLFHDSRRFSQFLRLLDLIGEMLHIYYNQLLFSVSFLQQFAWWHPAPWLRTAAGLAGGTIVRSRHPMASADQRSAAMALIARLPSAMGIVWLAVLPGCAVYETYEKCGFAGCPDDQRISRDVQALFEEHPALEPPNLIDVRTLDHVVYLNGVVDTDLERQLAESVAAGAQGVARVVNSIGLNNAR